MANNVTDKAIVVLPSKYYEGKEITWAEMTATGSATAQTVEFYGVEGKDLLVLVKATSTANATLKVELEQGDMWAKKAQECATFTLGTSEKTFVVKCETAPATYKGNVTISGSTVSKQKVNIKLTPSGALKGTDISTYVAVVEL